jgi:predicted nucleic acid-binding protein
MRYAMSPLLVMAEAVIDASALVDLLLGGPVGDAVARRIASHALHGPAHLDSEVFSAMGRLYRAGEIDVDEVETLIGQLVSAPIVRHPLPPLLRGAWERRGSLRLADALYVELAVGLQVILVTTDVGLAPVSAAEVVSVE